jgi:hypothetical protein
VSLLSTAGKCQIYRAQKCCSVVAQTQRCPASWRGCVRRTGAPSRAPLAKKQVHPTQFLCVSTKTAALCWCFIWICAAPGAAFADDARPSPQPSGSSAPSNQAQNAQAIQQAAANPIGSLISIPFQYNLNFGVGAFGHTQQVLNLQPVVPVDLGSGHTLVVRVIQPLIAQPQLSSAIGSSVGIGDMNPQLFYVPKNGPTMVGFGPALVFPTASNATMGQGKWSAGPNAVIVVTRPAVLYGLLVNNVWSFAGDPSRPFVNQFFAQPFYNWTLPKGLTVGIQSQSTANWEAAGNQKWTVPIGPTITQLIPLGSGLGQIGAAGFWNVVHPNQAGTFTARAVFVILMPVK